MEPFFELLSKKRGGVLYCLHKNGLYLSSWDTPVQARRQDFFRVGEAKPEKSILRGGCIFDFFQIRSLVVYFLIF